MEERDKKLKVLAALAADLNESDILWAVGASFVTLPMWSM